MYFRSSSDILAGRTKSVQIDIAILEVKKIKEKIELKDMEINDDPCKYYWSQYKLVGQYDCMSDCKYKGKVTAYGSDRY